MAYHYRRGGQHEKALLYLERAGDQAAAVFAHHVAEQHYRTALDLARAQGQRAQDGALLEKLAAVLGPLARYDEALVALEQAAERAAARAVDFSRRHNCRLMLLDALRVQALVLMRQERRADAAGVLEEGLALARTLPYPYAEARLQHVSGQLNAQAGEPQEARERLEGALALFGGLGAHRDAAQTEQALAALPQTVLANCSANRCGAALG